MALLRHLIQLIPRTRKRLLDGLELLEPRRRLHVDAEMRISASSHVSRSCTLFIISSAATFSALRRAASYSAVFFSIHARVASATFIFDGSPLFTRQQPCLDERRHKVISVVLVYVQLCQQHIVTPVMLRGCHAHQR